MIVESSPLTNTVRLSPWYLCDEMMRSSSVIVSLILSRCSANFGFAAARVAFPLPSKERPRIRNSFGTQGGVVGGVAKGELANVAKGQVPGAEDLSGLFKRKKP